MNIISDAPSRQTESPDPASHAANAYDTVVTGSEIDELDDDDMDFEPTTDESEDVEFFEAEEDGEDFRSMGTSFQLPPIQRRLTTRPLL